MKFFLQKYGINPLGEIHFQEGIKIKNYINIGSVDFLIQKEIDYLIKGYDR